MCLLDFQQDDDPEHSAHLVKYYLQNQQIEALATPTHRFDRRSCNSEDELFKQLNKQREKLCRADMK